MTALLTAPYARTHRALLAIAEEANLTPFDVRMLVALCESAEGVLDTHELEEALYVHGSAVRRSMLVLRRRLLIESKPKRGTRTKLKITGRGVMLARRVALLAAS